MSYPIPSLSTLCYAEMRLEQAALAIKPLHKDSLTVLALNEVVKSGKFPEMPEGMKRQLHARLIVLSERQKKELRIFRKCINYCTPQEALKTAVLEGSNDAVLWLLNYRRYQIDLQFTYDDDLSDGRTAFHLAASSGHEGVVRLLLENEDVINNINLQNRQGTTALHLAASSGHEGVVRLLLENEYVINNINLQNVNGETALHLAASNGHEGVVRLLLENEDVRNNINLQDFWDMTAFYLAARYGHEGVLRLLLENEDVRNNINLQNRNGMTALHLAADRGFESIVRLLLENGYHITSNDLRFLRSGHKLLIAKYFLRQNRSTIAPAVTAAVAVYVVYAVASLLYRFQQSFTK